MSVIELKGVSKEYDGRAVVNDVSLTIERSETLVLLGPSGCGKTTTLKMINRLITPSSGSIQVDGIDIQEVQPHELRRRIGYVIQQVGLFPHYSIRENIAMVPRLVGWSNQKINLRIQELLELMRLDENLLDRHPSQLSGGQQQRIGLARALAANPQVILLDEPFGALDPLTREGIRGEFKQMEWLADKTMVLVTHDVAEAIDLGDRICLFDQGIVQQIGTPRELIFNPVSGYVRDFFSHQQFQLEMKVATLGDIVPFFDTWAPTSSPDLVITQEESIWSSLDGIAGNPWIRVVDQDGQVRFEGRPASIYKAFQKFKSGHS